MHAQSPDGDDLDEPVSSLLHLGHLHRQLINQQVCFFIIKEKGGHVWVKIKHVREIGIAIGTVIVLATVNYFFRLR
ncbi:hypothetical protein D061_07298 [Streptococcus pneumoniae 1488]|nr:hypothetical protein D061_07298 [Streptococcus pneumoniae 1488]